MTSIDLKVNNDVICHKSKIFVFLKRMKMHFRPNRFNLKCMQKGTKYKFIQQLVFTVYATMISELIINRVTNELSMNDELYIFIKGIKHHL